MHNNNKYAPIIISRARKHLMDWYKDERIANRIVDVLDVPLEEVVEKTATATPDSPVTLSGPVAIRPMSPPLGDPEGELEAVDFPTYTTLAFLEAYDPESDTTVFTEPVDNFMPHLYSVGYFLRYYNRLHRNAQIATQDITTSKNPMPDNFFEVVTEQGYGVVPDDSRMKHAIRLTASGVAAIEEAVESLQKPRDEHAEEHLLYTPSGLCKKVGTRSIATLKRALKELGAETVATPAYVNKINGKEIYTPEQVSVMKRFLNKNATIEEYNAIYGNQTPCAVYSGKVTLREALLVATGMSKFKGFTSFGTGSRVYVATDKEN